jgi:hypothetical protein
MPWLKNQEWARSIKIMLIVALNQGMDFDDLLLKQVIDAFS